MLDEVTQAAVEGSKFAVICAAFFAAGYAFRAVLPRIRRELKVMGKRNPERAQQGEVVKIGNAARGKPPLRGG